MLSDIGSVANHTHEYLTTSINPSDVVSKSALAPGIILPSLCDFEAGCNKLVLPTSGPMAYGKVGESNLKNLLRGYFATSTTEFNPNEPTVYVPNIPFSTPTPGGVYHMQLETHGYLSKKL